MKHFFSLDPVVLQRALGKSGGFTSPVEGPLIGWLDGYLELCGMLCWLLGGLFVLA